MNTKAQAELRRIEDSELRQTPIAGSRSMEGLFDSKSKPLDARDA